MITFEQKDVFLVTGASSGIGESISLLLNKLGATVIGTARDSDKLKYVKSTASQPDNYHFESMDLSHNHDNIQKWMLSLKSKYGKFQGLIHAAGITKDISFQAITYNDAKQIFDINYFASIFLAKSFTDRRFNNGAGSSFTFISSIAATMPGKGQSLYGATKAAVNSSLLSLAKEVAPRQIRINSISPALIMSPMGRNFLEKLDINNTNKDLYPFGFGEVSDVASLAVFLASSHARWISGQNYLLDGGLSL